MKGFIIFQNQTGQLLYSKSYNSLPFTNCQEPFDFKPGSSSQGKGKQGSRSDSAHSRGGSPKKIPSDKIDKSQSQKEESKSANNTQIDSTSQSGKNKDGNETWKFSKESIDYTNDNIDNKDPQDLANQFFTIMQIAKMMGDEYREMYPKDFYNDANTKLAFRDGFTQMSSDSCDNVMEHCSQFPMTLILFYDSDIYLPSIMKSLAVKILEVFQFKFESKFDQGIYQDFTPKNGNYHQIYVSDPKKQKFDFSGDNPGTTFESTLPVIFEDTLTDYIKNLYINLNSMNLQVPWIYLIQNKELCGNDNRWVDPDFDDKYNVIQAEIKKQEQAKKDEEASSKKKKQKKNKSQVDRDSNKASSQGGNDSQKSNKTGINKNLEENPMADKTQELQIGQESKDKNSGIDIASPKAATPTKKDDETEGTMTNKTKDTRPSKGKESQYSDNTNKSEKRQSQRHREQFQMEKSVNKYIKDRQDGQEWEDFFEYKSDEQSIYRSFREFDAKLIPKPVTKKFNINKESKENKKIIQDMIKRFTEKTQTYELMIKFHMKVEKTDESTISMAGNTPGELVDQKERRRFVRQEIREYEKDEFYPFHQADVAADIQKSENLFNRLIDLFTKSNQMLNIMYQGEADRHRFHTKRIKECKLKGKEEEKKYRESNPEFTNTRENNPVSMDHLKYIEMQMNRRNSLLEKAKIVCIKLDRVFLIVPYTVSKIELRMRNILINNRRVLDGISHFMSFYLINQQFQTRLMKKYTVHLNEVKDLEYEAKFKSKGKNQSMSASGAALLGPAGASNYATNYSSNMPPVQSGSLPLQQSESIINVAVGESAFVNSNVGLTIDKP